jgi:hypothetical protein
MPPNLLILCHGGRGDIVNSEPPVRYLVEKVFHQSEKIAISSEFTEPFEHLQSEQVSLYLNEYTYEHMAEEFLGYTVLCAFEHDKRPVHGLNQPMMHGVDYASLHLLGYMPPEKYRRVRLLPPSKEEVEAMQQSFAELGLDLTRTLLIHPGQTWETRTIPAEWWKVFLESYPYPVCVIGSSDLRVCGDNQLVRGLLPATGVPSMANKLTIRGSIVAISQAKGLLTNDSYPLHVAGAFDNYLFYFATTKDEAALKPYGRKRAYNFSKNVIPDDWYTHLDIKVDFNVFPPGVTSLMPFLMHPKEAARFIQECFDFGG